MTNARKLERATAPERYTIAVDFDGVLHSYTSPWRGASSCPDPPVPGAIEWLNEIVKDFDVVILTTRGDQGTANAAIRKWLREHGYTGPDLRVTSEKVPALVYVDDRAWRFSGSNFPTAEQVHRARPWNKTTTDPRALGGDIVGPGQPYEQGGVVVNTQNAVLLQHTTVSIVGAVRDGVLDDNPVMALLLEGRINKTPDYAKVLFLGNADAMAALVTELIALASRGGWREEFLERVLIRLEAMPMDSPQERAAR